MIENSKTSTPESFSNAVESGGNEECNSSKEANHSQIAGNSTGINNGNAKEQPANPLQQIILIIEHKIRNLEKRKNKLESYKSIEKSGKKLTGDQKIAVSKYDECLTSLELTRELCKQFQTIVAAANKEAKKEAKRSVFIRAQQENAKIREVLIIQNVLKRFTEASVREDFLQGTNGACKIADSDLLLLEQLYEETLAKRPKTSAEPTFVTAVKQAADHLSAIVDGRNKPFADVTYVHMKNVLAEIQNCGYFDKDIITVPEEDSTDNAEDKEVSTEADEVGQVEETLEEETVVMTESNIQPKVIADPAIAPVLVSSEAPSMKVFAEAPAATAVPTPSFPTQPNMVRQVAPNPPAPTVPEVVAAPPLVAPPVHIPTQIVNANNGLSPANTPNVHAPAAIIVPTGPVTVPMMQPTATPMPPVPGQQLNATTVQAVENAYFKQHYIQQQMRPIHEVIGTGNFFFLQESEIDKPDVISTTVPFGNPLPSSNVTAQQTHPQVLIGQATNSSNQPPVDQQTAAPAQQAAMIAPQQQQQPQQNVMIGAQPPTFNNQPFQMASSAVKSFNHSMQPQAMETRQISQPMNAIPHSRSPVVSKTTDHGHIPGFTTKHTTVVATQSVAPKEQIPIAVQPTVPDESQSNAQRQSVQKNQLPQQKPMVVPQGTGMNQPFNANLQQYPSLVQNLHESPNQTVTSNLSQNLPGLMVDATTEKLKASLNLSEKFPLNQPHLSQQHSKLRHDEWNRGSDFAPSVSKSEDQWSNSSMARSSAVDSGSNNKAGQYPLSNQAKPVSVASENSTPNAGPVVNEASKRNEQNDNMTSNYVQDLQGTHGASHQAQPTYGHRNTRGASSSQYQQNNGTNARFDNGMNNSSSTFFKNNERFYQQNQTSNYGSNKSDSSYHQRSSMFKNRNDNNGNPQSRGGAGYSSTVPSGGTAPPSNNNNSNNSGNFGSGMDYRSNARPVNSTRNTGPPSSRPHQRNHSGNSYGGPRGGSNSRAPQSSINA